MTKIIRILYLNIIKIPKPNFKEWCVSVMTIPDSPSSLVRIGRMLVCGPSPTVYATTVQWYV